MIATSKIFPQHDRTKTANELREGIEYYNPSFRRLLPEEPELMHHWRGTEWAEGPVYLSQRNAVIWSDIPNNRMLEFNLSSRETSVFREPSNYTNGNTVDLEGRLISAQHLPHCILRTEHDGTLTVLVDRYNGNRLNSPNDVVVKSDGTIWFTDPPYGILSDREGRQRKSEINGCYVYRFDEITGILEIVVDSMDRPNGLAFSPGEDVLYVSDTGKPENLMAFDLSSDGQSLENGREFAKVRPGTSDGFRCDAEGNLWTSAEDGIQCYTAEAELIGKILIPEQRVANCCFGGPDAKTLYIAGDTSLYSIALDISGAQSGM